ncbi:MAG: prepilin-type N-terminal cleavage/methylation domain-containing protein [Candidatus Paceibacterota bacterium]
MKKSIKGFTLVEIMIVVGIIAILSGMFLVGAGKFRDSANDARRKSDLQKIVALQELCYTKAGSYAGDPGTLASCSGAAVPKDPVTKADYTIGTNSASATLSDATTYSITW